MMGEQYGKRNKKLQWQIMKHKNIIMPQREDNVFISVSITPFCQGDTWYLEPLAISSLRRIWLGGMASQERPVVGQGPLQQVCYCPRNGEMEQWLILTSNDLSLDGTAGIIRAEVATEGTRWREQEGTSTPGGAIAAHQEDALSDMGT